MQDLLNAFVRQVSGAWVCVRHTSFEGPQGRIEVARGTIFRPGTQFMGIDLAAWLDEQLGRRARGAT